MPLPNPILDDRSYAQLRDELVRRIPVYAPEWTDHNAGDPGIALVELFAFLGENLLFRFNQIPEAAKLAFLRLLQLPVRPAAPARTLAALTTQNPDGVLVPLGTELRAGNLPFRTTTEAVAWPVSVLAVAKRSVDKPDAGKEPDVAAFAARAVDALNDLKSASPVVPVWYAATPLSADGAGPPVDFTRTVDRTLWVAVLREKTEPVKPFHPATLNLGFVPDPVVPKMAEVPPCPGAGTTRPVRRVEWQVFHGEFRPDTGDPIFHPIQPEGDTTDGLTREGVVRLRVPPRQTPPSVDKPDEDLAGTGDRPPALDDPKDTLRVLYWLRAFRPDDDGGFGKVLDVSANAVEATQAAQAQLNFLGTGTGQPDQRYTLAHRPILAGTLTVQVEEAGTWRTWTEIDSFHAAGADDRVYVLDRDAGEVRFGSRFRGWPPQVGERIRATEYQYGGGSAGNVPAKAVAKVLGVQGVKVANRQKAKGGADGESVEDALARIPGEVRRHDRAVTASDFREIALATPGADLGRAECLPRFFPATPGVERPGVVSVVVWPKDDPKHPNAPLPDRDTLRAVCCWLDARRLVTTELYVIPPTYRKVAVSVGVKVKPGYGTEAVRRWVELILRQYLAPLPPFGPSGGGWPLGRRVHGPELEAAVLQVEGVEYIEGLIVGGLAADGSKYTPGTVDLLPYEVPELAAVSVTDAAPLALATPPTPPTAGTTVPVPVIREVC